MSPITARPLSVQDFPPEIFNVVLDCLDTPTLKSSSLVCKTWWYIARPHLYSSLIVRGQERLPSFQNLRDQRPSEVTTYTRRLVIDFLNLRRKTFTNIDTIARLVDAVPMMEKLELRHLALNGPELFTLSSTKPPAPAPASDARPLSRRPLRKLGLKTCHSRLTCPSVDPLIGLLALFSSIDDARLDFASQPDSESSPGQRWSAISPVPMLRIRSLALARWNDTAATLARLAPLLPSGHLRALRCPVRDEKHAEVLGRFLRQHGPGLEHLSLRTELRRRSTFGCPCTRPRVSRSGIGAGPALPSAAKLTRHYSRAALEMLPLDACTCLVSFATYLPRRPPRSMLSHGEQWLTSTRLAALAALFPRLPWTVREVEVHLTGIEEAWPTDRSGVRTDFAPLDDAMAVDGRAWRVVVRVPVGRARVEESRELWSVEAFEAQFPKLRDEEALEVRLYDPSDV
ncbi:uncharacterized protein BXZ73DRAFT_82548 [Epithele typhae]|uniref:uncharacterized protein n=1 Tax=Epithele typhae TaxID=378194 RepID=UPI0020081A7E|nr:uncharacterized protein BXZ73DRAFT_82548 [Epithele typhae]KAH9912002.1 hypothetical protein BXZ73DRAFT_82548 [Epithele typhae]